jgi:hypothetical protein
MQTLTERQLRHQAVITNRLAAMDGRALFHAMRDWRSKIGARSLQRSTYAMQRYADSMRAIRAELARRGLA